MHPTPEVQFDRIIRKREAARLVGLSASRLDAMYAAGQGPRRLRLGTAENSPVGYRLSDLNAWLAALAGDAPPPAAPAPPAPAAVGPSRLTRARERAAAARAARKAAAANQTAAAGGSR